MSSEPPETSIFDIDDLLVQTNEILRQSLQQQEQLNDLISRLRINPDINITDIDETTQPTTQTVPLSEAGEGLPPAITESNAQVIPFPAGSVGSQARTLLGDGDNIVNFAGGNITRPGNLSDVNISGNIGSEEKLWSLLLWTDNDITVKVSNQNIGETPVFMVDQGSYLSIAAYPFDRLIITPIEGFRARVFGVASQFVRPTFDRLPISSHQIRSDTGFTTEDSYQTIRTILVHSFESVSMRVKNVGGSNDADVRFQSRTATDQDWHTDYELSDQGTADEAQLGTGESFRFNTTENFRFARIRARSTASSSPTDIEAETVARS